MTFDTLDGSTTMSSIAGLLRCGHCDRRIQVRDNGGAIRYRKPICCSTSNLAISSANPLRLHMDRSVPDALPLP